MKKIVIFLVGSLFVAAFFGVIEQVRAQDAGESRLKLSAGAGGLVYGVLGPRAVREGFLEIEFDKKSFKPGLTIGGELMYFPSSRHSLSLGAFYEQRRIDLRILDISILGAVSPTLLFIPIDSLVTSTSLGAHYINMPLTYRFQFSEYLYAGIGIDAACLVAAKADYSVFILNMSINLKRHLSPVDLGARVVGGYTAKNFFGEVSMGVGILDFDKLGGVRRSVYVKAMAGYRFF